MLRVGIIDYGLANMKSVGNAFACFDVDARPVATPAGLDTVERVVLPGVGSFDMGMQALRERGFVEALERRVRDGGLPCLGICLGLQFLFEGSEEGSETGLGWIRSKIQRFPVGANQPKVPHIGWSDVTVATPRRLFAEMEQRVDFYFVHSYYAPLDDATKGVATATCDYGVEFVAGLENENVMAVQFHPEKSQLAGMKVIENFLATT
jgi:imidazole glycerol-phosphate synthase subunit HisH